MDDTADSSTAIPQAADIITRRASTRAFSPEPIPTALIESVLDAARWAPSYGNRQPTRFVVVQDSTVLERVHESLTHGNAYAKVAPVMVAVCGAPEWGQQVDGRDYYLMDAGLAVENLLLQAVEVGFVGHPLGGFNEAMVRDALGIPSGVRVLALIALGIPGNIEDLDEGTRERELRPRTRKSADAIRTWDQWVWDDDGEPRSRTSL